LTVRRFSTPYATALYPGEFALNLPANKAFLGTNRIERKILPTGKKITLRPPALKDCRRGIDFVAAKQCSLLN
jgi:hypothetical protein